VFCLVDDWLASQRLRQRGPRPTLAASEILTIEWVGEFLGIDTDIGRYQYFRSHWGDWFPGLRRVHRTSFARQAANLWAVKAQLHRDLLSRIEFDPAVSLVDSVAIAICRFARADRCRRLRELAAWGHDEAAKQTYLGLRAHLRVCWPGVILDGRLAPANCCDLAVGTELLGGVAGWTLADRTYGSARLAAQLAAQGGWLLAPPRGVRRSGQRPPPWLVGKRRRGRDGDRPAGRALPPQAGVGPRRLASVVALAAQAAQPHHRGPALPAAGGGLSPIRRLGCLLNPHTG
jgi:hypothetical protein